MAKVTASQLVQRPDKSLDWPISYAGVELIAGFEGLRLKAYLCPAGKWTCGWGETDGVGPHTRFTKDFADARFCDSLAERARAVLALCKIEPSANELAALVSLAYNIGVAALKKSTVLRAHNRADAQAAIRAFGLWNKITDRRTGQLRVSAGLTSRRAREAAIYATPDDDDDRQRMPQEVVAESSLVASPIAQGGAATAGLGVVSAFNEVGDKASAAEASVGAVKSMLIDTIGIPSEFWLPVAAVAVGGAIIWWRVKQRRDGWA